MSDPVETKVCSRCTERKSIDEFYFISKKLGTRRGQCRTCMGDIKAMQKDPEWRPSCSACNKKMERFGPGRRLCAECFDAKYDLEGKRSDGSHRLQLKPCPLCGTKRLREDHEPNTSLCAVCRSVPPSRRKTLKLYNLTPRDFVTLLEDQAYRCWICERKPKKSIHVDHSHSEPMVVRGLVCSRCNTLLAIARDDPHILRGAAKFLESPPAQYVFPGLVATPEANRKGEGWRKVTRTRVTK